MTTAITRRAALRAAGLAGLGLPALAPAARAQSRFPDRPITILVPFPAGGSTDVVMRALAEVASRHLGQPVVVDNRPGAGSSLGPAAVARARPDGYLLTQLPTSAIRLSFIQRMSYDPLRDFTPIVHLTGYLFGIVVPKDSRWQSWADFVAEAKRRPGALNVGNAGMNGTPHLGTEMLCQREGIQVTHIPYRGEAESVQAMLGGHVDAAATSSLGGVMVTEGRARWLNIWAAQRSAKWPDAPTLEELGHRGLVLNGPYGLVGPAGMDPAVVARLHDAFAVAMRDPQHLAVLERFDMAMDYRNTADYAAFLREVVRQEQDMVNRLGLRQG